MLFDSTNQYIALAIVLFAGWLLGLASSSGGRKWRDRYTTERDAHATLRRDTDSHRATRDARVAELERENARLASAQPVTQPVTGAPVAGPVAARAARPAYSTTERRSWFDFAQRR